MESIFVNLAPVSESYSRQLDKRVQLEEKPYGYDMPPPPADTGNYDMRSRESHKQYSPRSKNG